MIAEPEELAEEQKAMLARLRVIEERMGLELAAVRAARTGLENLCAHEWSPRGHDGPYEVFVCLKCNAEDLVL